MLALQDFPALNATLNGLSGLCLAGGYVMIRQKRRVAHAACMVTATVGSVIFLVCYLYYHSRVGHVRFQGTGWIHPVYVTLLLTHTVLAMVVALYLAPVTLVRALRQRFDRHRQLARWTLPIWFYVSVTGVVIYFMLYHWYAAGNP